MCLCLLLLKFLRFRGFVDIEQQIVVYGPLCKTGFPSRGKLSVVCNLANLVDYNFTTCLGLLSCVYSVNPMHDFSLWLGSCLLSSPLPSLRSSKRSSAETLKRSVCSYTSLKILMLWWGHTHKHILYCTKSTKGIEIHITNGSAFLTLFKISSLKIPNPRFCRYLSF